MLLYDLVLDGEDATLENAVAHAQGQDWQAMTKTENGSLPYLEYKDEVNGIEIWCNYGCDCYLFTDSNDER